MVVLLAKSLALNYASLEEWKENKDDYLQLFIDINIALKFVEDKATIEGEKLDVDLEDSLSSPRTISDVTCMDDCTHVALEEPHVQGKNEECLMMQVLDSRSDMELYQRSLVAHLEDHELFAYEEAFMYG